MAKYSINLLQEDLIPAKALWTLNRVVLVWGATLVVMVALIFLLKLTTNGLNKEFNQLTSTASIQTARLSELELAVSKNRQDGALIKQLNTVKLVIANKKQLHQQLTDPKQTYSAGFSTVMVELAELHNKNISLQRVNIGNDNMTFTGLARTPDAVPYWLSGFESSTFLAGKTFVNFMLSDNEQRVTEFVVSSASSSELDIVLGQQE